MKYCPSCKVLLNNDSDKCSLCYKKTVDKNVVVNKQEYPKYYYFSKQNHIIQGVLALLTIQFGFLAIILNIWFFAEAPVIWSVWVCFGSFILWMTTRLVIFSQRNLSIRLLAAHSIVFWVLLLLDVVFSMEGFRFWSLTYATPFLSIVFLSVTLIIVLTKTGSYPDYFGNIILHILFMILPIVLYFTTDIISTIIPGLISAIIALITLVAILVLPSKEMKEEIKKRLHI